MVRQIAGENYGAAIGRPDWTFIEIVSESQTHTERILQIVDPNIRAGAPRTGDRYPVAARGERTRQQAAGRVSNVGYRNSQLPPLSVEPHQPLAAAHSRQEDERAVVCYGEVRGTAVECHAYSVAHQRRWTGCLQPSDIEPLRQQFAFAHHQQIAGGIGSVGTWAGGNKFNFRRIDPAQVDSVLALLAKRKRKQKMTAIRKKARKAMINAHTGLRDRHRRAPRGAYLV